MTTKISLTLALLLVHGFATAQCTPAAVNPGLIQKIKPRMALPAVTTLASCIPEVVTTELGTAAAFHVPDHGFAWVFFDAEGVLSAGYGQLAPDTPSNGALRVDRPKPNTWLQGAGK